MTKSGRRKLYKPQLETLEDRSLLAGSVFTELTVPPLPSPSITVIGSLAAGPNGDYWFNYLYPFTMGYTLQLLIAIMQNYEQARTEAVSTMPAVAKAC